MNDLCAYVSEKLDAMGTSYETLFREHASLQEKYARLARSNQRFVWWAMAGWAAFGLAVARLIYLGVR